MSAPSVMPALPPEPPDPAGCTGADELLCRWAIEGGPRPETDPERLAEIYARPGFEDAASRASDGWERLLAEFFELLESLFETSGAQGFAEWTRFLVLAVAAILLALWVWRWGRGALARRDRTPPDGRVRPQPLPAALEPSGLHLARARGLVEHAPREGIREGLLGLLSALEGAGLSRRDRVRTNRELARELPARGASDATVREVRGLLDWYDRAFYSLGRVEASDARGFLASVEALVSTLPEARA